MTSLSRVSVRIAGSVAVVLALVAGVCPIGVQAQSQDPGEARIQALHAEIDAARAAGAGREQIGKLWLKIGRIHESRMRTAEAEDAFARAIQFLRDGSDKRDYADAWQGMSAIYVLEGRVAEAKTCLKKSSDIYQELGDWMHVAELQEGIAVQLLSEHKYQEADDEASLAIKALNFDPSLDASDLMAAYLTRSHALCSMGHCEKALEDLAHARSAAEGRLAANSLEMVALWATEGMDQMRTGHVEEGSRAMREALRLAKSRTDLPETMVSQLQLGMLREYAGALKDAHRKDEAKQVEAEAVRLQERVPQGCGGCTVGVAALAFAPPR